MREYPYWSSWVLRPFSLIPKQCVGHDNQFSHDGCDGQFFAFPGRDQLLVFCLHVWIEACCNNRWQIDRVPDTGAPALERSLPCHFPDCLDMGARPANAAACLPVRSPSSGMSVRIAQAVTLAMPGMLVRISARAARSSSAATMASISSVTWQRSRSICAKPFAGSWLLRHTSNPKATRWALWSPFQVR